MADQKDTQKPRRTRTKPGMHSLYVTVSDEMYAKLEATADGRPINVWLSRLIERADFAELKA